MKALMKRVFSRSAPKPEETIIREHPQRADKPLATSYLGSNDAVLQCYVSYNKYGGYCVPQRSHRRPAAQKILVGEVWEPDTIEFIVGHSGDGDIVHAGAYFGDFIPALSRGCADHAKLWAFEPNPENYRCALITIEINNLKNVEIRNGGLGAQEGSFFMEIADESGEALGGGSRFVGEGDRSKPERFIEVNVFALDHIVPSERHISVLQLDVEGFEQQALIGAMDTIKRCQPILILENCPEDGWLDENILSLGYQVSGKLHKNTVLAIDGIV
jgi:FkbM family methyltransferase